jgi:nicotinate-nucleotide pyrophosphorylase (carboxylating)
MDIAHIRESVSVIQNRAIVEVSGGIALKHLADLAETGVDLISVGALTHSARAVDLSMRIQ